MVLTREKSRDKVFSPEERIQELFPGKVCGVLDVESLSRDGKTAIGVCGLPFKAPMCFAVTNCEKTYKYIASFGEESHLFAFCNDSVRHYTPSGEKKLPKAISNILFDILHSVIRGVGSISADGSHDIPLKTEHGKAYKVGLHYDVNLLIGDRSAYPDPMLTTPKSAVDSLGRGSFRSGAARQVLASRFTLVPEENGDPVNRQFYLVEDGKQIFYSANLDDNVKTAVCHHKRNRTVIEYTTEDGLRITRTIFILPQEDGMPEAIEAQKITLENLTKKKRKIKLVASGMFGLCSPESTMGDIIYASITWEGGVIKSDGTPVAVVPSPNPKYLAPNKRFATLISGGEFFDGYCTSYSEFIGEGSVLYPDGVKKLTSAKARKIVPFFAMEKETEINSGEKKSFTELTGMTLVRGGSDDGFLPLLSNVLEKYRSDAELDAALEKSVRFFEDYCGYIKINSGDGNFDSYVGANLPFQVYYQSFVSRSFAWTQKAFREIGFREIQDLEAGLYYFVAMGKGALVKTMLKSWVSNVFEMGYANHNFYEKGKEAGACSDDQLWLSQAVYRYVTMTGDVGFLSEKCPTAEGTSERTVLDTLLKTIEYSGRISVGAHGLPLMDRADWNDCLKLDADFLDGPSKQKLYFEQLEKSGEKYGAPLKNDLSESVMNAFLLKIAADNTSELAKLAKNDEEASRLSEFSRELEEKIQRSSWINGYFVRAHIGGGRDYKYLGSQGDGLGDDNSDGTYYLNSFSWSILAGVATEEQIESMLEKVEKHLKTDAGLKLCTFAALDRLGAGTSAVNYFYGDRENGGVFKHANMMATCAMLKAAKEVKSKTLASRLSELAFWTVGKVLPYKTLENPYVLCGNPRFCTQFNNCETGENIGPMLSGTASWLALTVFEMLGISFTPEKILLSPVPTHSSEKLEYSLRIENLTLDITVTKPAGFARVCETSKCLLDGKPSDFAVPRDLCGNHSIEITL